MAAWREDGNGGYVAEAARNRQVWLLFWLRLFTQAIRMVWAPLVVYIGKDEHFRMPAAERGGILASFSLGYLMTQIIGGVLSDRYGGAPLAATALLVDGAAMLLAPACGSALGLHGISGCYFVMGLFSGVAHPAYNNILAAWVPQRDIGRASNLGEAGAVAGTLLATSGAPALASSWGWPYACYAFGAATLAFGVAWVLLAASQPLEPLEVEEGVDHELRGLLRSTEAADGSDDEVEVAGPGERRRPNDLIMLSHKLQDDDGHGGSEREPPPPVPPSAILLHLPMWVVIWQHICFNGHRYFFVEWMPTYFDDVFRMPPSRSCLYLSMPEVLGLAAPGLVGPLERHLLRRGWSLLDSRRFFGCVGFCGMAVVVLQLSRLAAAARLQRGTEAFVSFLPWLALNPLFNTMHSCGYKANYMDLTKDYSGLFMGFGNTFATLGNYIMPLAVGSALRAFSGDWTPAFQCICFLDICAALAALFGTSVDRIDPWLESLRKVRRAKM